MAVWLGSVKVYNWFPGMRDWDKRRRYMRLAHIIKTDLRFLRYQKTRELNENTLQADTCSYVNQKCWTQLK